VQRSSRRSPESEDLQQDDDRDDDCSHSRLTAARGEVVGIIRLVISAMMIAPMADRSGDPSPPWIAVPPTSTAAIASIVSVPSTSTFA